MSANKFKNEQVIKIGAEEILLRPTFENISNLESKMGGVQYLAFKYSLGVTAKANLDKVKNLPSISDCALIIYFCQAKQNPQDPQEKEFSLEQIFEKIQGNLKNIPAECLMFLGKMLSGNKMAVDLSEKVKKN